MTTIQDENREIRTTLARLNARAWGIAMGLLLGGGLFVATMVLVMRGGANVGQHLGLLRAYFPGYSVTIHGSFIGFIYAFVVGYALGRVIGMVYNRVVTVSR
ncbi:MAG TPA: hypothetical protein VL241_03785 [Gemmatimonadales bacterium]|nr:hypothetical protein [Gemmatimonadales bacterium]